MHSHSLSHGLAIHASLPLDSSAVPGAGCKVVASAAAEPCVFWEADAHRCRAPLYRCRGFPRRLCLGNSWLRTHSSGDPGREQWSWQAEATKAQRGSTRRQVTSLCASLAQTTCAAVGAAAPCKTAPAGDATGLSTAPCASSPKRFRCPRPAPLCDLRRTCAEPRFPLATVVVAPVCITYIYLWCNRSTWRPQAEPVPPAEGPQELLGGGRQSRVECSPEPRRANINLCVLYTALVRGTWSARPGRYCKASSTSSPSAWCPRSPANTCDHPNTSSVRG